MLPTRIIFVEGLIGSGKSTTAEFLAAELDRRGISARFLAEGPTVDTPTHPLRVSPGQSIEVTICDGLLFHGNATDLFLMSADVPRLHDYVFRIIETIRDLKPCVVYLDQPNVASALRVICDERGPDWEKYQVNWKTSSPYANKRLLRGFDGLVDLYRAFRTLIHEILEEMALPKLVIRHRESWAQTFDEILAFLGVRPCDPLP